MKKKLASFALALAMCLALALPAFATQTSRLSSTLESMLPELAMTMPDSATIILNPYRMATTTSGTGIDSGDRFQIMNAVFSVVSATTAKVHVSATVTGTAKGATFATAAIAPGDTNKNVYLTLTHAISHSATAAVPVADDATSPTNVLVVSDSEQTLNWDLPAASPVGTETTNTPQRVDLQFGGNCSDSPESPWTSSDTVSCSFVFTVNPVTDIPMVATTYQNATTAPDLTFATLAPPDANSTTATADYKVTEVRVGDSHAAAVAATVLSDIAGSTWTGTLVTIPAGKISSSMGTSTTTKYVVVTLTYMDSQSTPVKQTIQYEAKVSVKAAS